MIDLHTHSFFSDGVLVPSELAVRALNAGYKALAVTDHVDFTNIDFVIPRIKKVVVDTNNHYKIKLLAGCEITYVPPKLIIKAVNFARQLGAQIVLVHGETPVEPVPPGTNRAAIEAGCDILAHPGYIKKKDVLLAAKKCVYLEITTRQGHCKANSAVAAAAKKYNVKLVLNTDAHQPGDLLTESLISKTLCESGLNRSHYAKMTKNSWELLKRKKGEI